MSFWGRLFGTEKALNSVVDGAVRGLDALVYTDEEKAGDAAADRSEARKMIVAWMASTQGQNLARRLLALIITSVWLFQYLASMLLNVAAVWALNKDVVARLQATSVAVGDRAESMNGAMMLILAFYFAAPHMGDIAKAAIGKFGSPVNKG